MHRIGEPGRSIQRTDHQAAGADTILLKLDTMEKQAISDATACKDDILT